MLQIVRITNTGDTDLILTHNGDRYVVPVDGSKIVPYECAASAFGDPRARDNGRDKGRTDIYEHTRAMWNFNLGFDDADAWEAKRPRFEAHDVNSGDRIWFVIDDPKGEHIYDATGGVPVNTNTTDAALLGAQLTAMQEQIAALTTALALTQSQSTGTSHSAPTVIVATDNKQPADALDKVVEKPVADAGPAPDGKDAAGSKVAGTQELPPVPATPAKVKADGPKRA